MFKTFQSAAVLTGCVAGVIYTIDAAGSRFESNELQGLASLLLAPLSLLATSAVARRSLIDLVVALIFTIVITPLLAFVEMIFLLNGRNDLPLVVWSAPYQAIAVPGGSDSWPLPALLNYAFFWFVFNAAQLYLREGQLWPFRSTRLMNTRTCVRVMMPALIPVLVLFPMSWWAMVSGTFTHPLYTEFQYYASLGVYFLIYPVTNWWLYFLADRSSATDASTSMANASCISSEPMQRPR